MLFNIISALVTTYTQLWISQLYVAKPTEAAMLPRNSHLETPSVPPEIHCLWTCFATVRSKMKELAQPITSVDIDYWTPGADSVSRLPGQQCFASRQDLREGIGSQRREMAHFPAGSRFELPIEMQL